MTTRTTRDVNFPAYWHDEKDWLVMVVALPKDEPEDNVESLEWIGRLFAFSWATNTRMLAQVGDPKLPLYELWFSFDSESHKQEFFQLVRDDGFGSAEGEDGFAPRSAEAWSEIGDLRPIACVFSKNDADTILLHSVLTALMMDVNPSGII